MFKKKSQKKFNFIDPFFLSLPIDLWINIIKYASVKDVMCLFMLSKASNSMMQHEVIQTKHILPYRGMPMYLFRALKVNHNDVPDKILFLLAGSAEDSKKAILRGHFYYNIVSPNRLLDYMPSVLEITDLNLRYNNKILSVTINDLQATLEFPIILHGSRSLKPSVLIIYPSSVDELKTILKAFLPKKSNEIIVVCSPHRQILDKALEMKCKPLIISNELSVEESNFVFHQSIALISRAVTNNQSNKNHCLLM